MERLDITPIANAIRAKDPVALIAAWDSPFCAIIYKVLCNEKILCEENKWAVEVMFKHHNFQRYQRYQCKHHGYINCNVTWAMIKISWLFDFFCNQGALDVVQPIEIRKMIDRAHLHNFKQRVRIETILEDYIRAQRACVKATRTVLWCTTKMRGVWLSLGPMIARMVWASRWERDAWIGVSIKWIPEKLRPRKKRISYE